MWLSRILHYFFAGVLIKQVTTRQLISDDGYCRIHERGFSHHVDFGDCVTRRSPAGLFLEFVVFMSFFSPPSSQPSVSADRRWKKAVITSLLLSVSIGVAAGVLVSGPREIVAYALRALQSLRSVTPNEPIGADERNGKQQAIKNDGQLVVEARKHIQQETSIELSSREQRSLGVEFGKVALSSFQRTIHFPGVVVERPGRTRHAIIAPMAGQVTKVFCTPGSAVQNGQQLFELRLTHEALVQAQADLLSATEEADVVRREFVRLDKLQDDGLISTKRILEQEYELQKLEGKQRIQRQALMLHGLSGKQIDEILSTKSLLRKITVCAPTTGESTEANSFVLQALQVERGEYVSIGDTLAVLVDHSTLLIEGVVLEKDIPEISNAAVAAREVKVLFNCGISGASEVCSLSIAYLATEIDPQAGTLKFFVTLPNERIPSLLKSDSPSITWQFRPGQHVDVVVPVEEWPERIVLPSAAVAQDGVENYVFRIKADRFHQQPVEVEYRDSSHVVLANDGSLEIGETVALAPAQRLLIMLHASTGGRDVSAGHNR